MWIFIAVLIGGALIGVVLDHVMGTTKSEWTVSDMYLIIWGMVLGATLLKI